MEAAATIASTPATAPTARALPRSPVLNAFRLNPFRVLRVALDVGPDEAVWRAEELLTLRRAGLPPPYPDLLPWLPEPDEPEFRQALQAVEEPLRRLVEGLFWFDPSAGPDGLLATLAEPELPERPPPPAPAPAGDGEATGPSPQASAPAGMADAEVPGALNRANLALLHGALSLSDQWSGGRPLAAAEAPTVAWSVDEGLTVAGDPHLLALDGGREARRCEAAAGLWREAIRRWMDLLRDPALERHVRAAIARLGDETVGEEDAETVLSAASTRLMDLLAGEIKLQVLDGRWGRVRALLEVARGAGFDGRRWAAALRPLRSIFRTEAAELEPLMGDQQSPSLRDVELYLGRVKSLAGRWAGLDPEGWLGLGEVVDEAVGKAVAALMKHQNYGLLDRLKKALGQARDAAAADSTKRRIEAHSAGLDGLARWECHFCRAREMDPKFSAMISGKKETGRTYSGNTTTIHYQIMRNIVQRCGRCADFHGFLLSVGSRTRWIMAAPLAIIYLYILFQYYPGNERDVSGWLFLLALSLIPALIFLAAAGKVARGVAALAFTPGGERRYWDYRDSRQYKELKAEGFGEISIDATPQAFQNAVKGRK
jgi:hypothetical protein